MLIFFSCADVNLKEKDTIRFEVIDYFKTVEGIKQDSPYLSRYTYFFDNGKPHRYIEKSTDGDLTTDFIYKYDDNWVHSGALYKQNNANKWSIERVTYSGDSSQATTEWLDSSGTPYYKMVEDLNEWGKPSRAAFIGQELHGYDTAYYTPQGWEKRIFFTNVKGKVFNDRSFDYTEIDQNNEWITRHKKMGDTLQEVHHRTIYYDNLFTHKGIWYNGIFGGDKIDLNYLSLTAGGKSLFYTEGNVNSWTKQFGYISNQENGVYTLPERVRSIDTIYNGAISPSGDKILFSKRDGLKSTIWLINKVDDHWSQPINLTFASGIEGGYFYWWDDSTIYMYVTENEGDLVRTQLKNDTLKIDYSFPELNTNDALEFGPYVHPKLKYILFTKYLAGDKAQQGVFISVNSGSELNPQWESPERIEGLPYSWGVQLSQDLQTIIYTNGDSYFSVNSHKILSPYIGGESD